VSVRAYDPIAMQEARRIYGDRQGLRLCGSAIEALDGADALAICTEWQEFRSPDFATLRAMLREPVIFDGRNLYSPALLAGQGIRYYGIGRSNAGVA
jgi:UDPglucose 6-dehydrogenase